MNQAVAKPDQAFQQNFKRLAPQIKKALPSHIDYDRFERVCMVAVQREPKLLTADQRSLFLACQNAAADGLLPDGREGALVIYGGSVRWMPMVAGLMRLARNSGQIASITAHVAYAGEKFQVTLGDEEHIEHIRSLDLPDNAQPIAAYAIATLKSGEKIREAMTWHEVMKIRKSSRSTSSDSPWQTWTEEMAKKSAIRRLSKRLPLSTDRIEDEKLREVIERPDDSDVIEGVAEPLDPFETAAAGLTAPVASA